MNRILRFGAAICLVTVGACASAGGSSGPAASRNVIELSEIQGTQHGDAYVLVQALRPQWLEVRGIGSLAGQHGKRVYLDNMLLGDINTLRQVTAASIQAIHYYDGPAATQRWGTDHAAGVIQIRARR